LPAEGPTLDRRLGKLQVLLEWNKAEVYSKTIAFSPPVSPAAASLRFSSLFFVLSVSRHADEIVARC
jgi:hypothetical protein